MKETNMEHYRGEIEDVLKEKKGGFAIRNGKIEVCQGKPCKECEFRSLHCISGRMTWLMSEYKPEPVLTEREKHFVEFAQEGWLARDEGDYLNYFHEEPCKDDEKWLTGDWRMSLWMMQLNDMFPFITWEDEEPWSVADLRKLKALEYNPEDVAFKDGGAV